MEILLLNPPYTEKITKEGRCEQKSELFEAAFPPLELAYIVAILRHKHNVKILDCIASRYNEERLISFYRKEKPSMVFVSTTTATISNDLRIIEKLNEVYKSKFVFFGVYASYFRKRLMKKGIIVPNNVEEYACKIVGEGFNPASLDSLPFPAWDLVNLKNYRLPLTGERFVLIQTSKGCRYECTFCTVPFYHGKKLLKRSINSVIEEILYVKKFGINNILFFADNFASDKYWVEGLCKEIIRRNIKIRFLCNSRVDSLDKETIQLMKKAGCWLISFGIESGSQKILNIAKKGIKIENAKEAISKASSKGILTLGNFVLGLEGENENTIKETIGFANQLNLDFAVFNIAASLPGSALYEMSKQKTLKRELINETELERWQKNAYLSFYSRKPFVRFFRVVKITGIKYLLPIINSAFYSLSKILF